MRLDPADAPEMSLASIEQAFRRPIGTAAVRDLAVGKRACVIAVDDLTRPTPAHQILPALIRELNAGGLALDRISILIGLAAHRPASQQEIEQKVGRDIATRLPIIMHDFVGPDIRYVGCVAGGPVYLNRHFLEADLRIVVGSVIPHDETGFGGGAKMVVPGVAGRLTIAHFHGALPPRRAGELEPEKGVRDRRAWAEEVARHVGVHTAVCAVINSRRQLAGLFVGDVIQAHRAAAARALDLARTIVPHQLAQKADVAIVNAYPLDTDPIQMAKSLLLTRKLPVPLTVAINAASDGIFYHGMGMGCGVSVKRLLRNLPGFLSSGGSVRAWVRGLAVASPHPILMARTSYFALNHLSYADFTSGDGQRPGDEKMVSVRQKGANPWVLSARMPAWGFRRKYRHGRLYRDWGTLRAALQRRFKEISDPTVLVFPCAPLQLPSVQAES